MTSVATSCMRFLQHQTAVKSGGETDRELLSRTKVAAHSTWGVPYKPVCFFFFLLLLAVTAATVTIPCHHCQWGLGQLLTRTTPTLTHTHTHTQPSLLYNYNQALGPMVIGLSHSSSQQRAMAHSCLATMAVKKKWHNKRQHKQTSRRDPGCNIQMVANQAINTSPGNRRPRTWSGKTGSALANRKWHGPSHLGPPAQ